ncbi:MAG: tetratricopeptide repeat protein [Iamia sp.]
MTSPTRRSRVGRAGSRPHAERTEFLLQSIRDLEAERAAGDIDDADYEALREDYTARAATALRAEEKGRAAPVAAPAARSWGQRVLVAAGVVGFALLVGVLVAQASGRREDGEGITGEITQTPTQQASECIDLTTAGQMVDALPCYEEVLTEDPDNAVAHTYLGWTLFLTARQSGAALPQDTLVNLYVQAGEELDAAVEADPGYADARAFQIVFAVREGDFEEAALQLEAFDGLDAPADVKGLVDGIRQDVTDGLAGEGDGDAPASTTTVPSDPSSPTTPS